MHRTYAENLDLTLDIATINNKTEIHHIRDVLRLRVGDRLNIFNGGGIEVEGEIIFLNKEEVQLKIINRREVRQDPSMPYVILACAIPKKDKFEWIIEKVTELGVMEIIPLKTERTEFKVNAERSEKKEQRYKAVAINASKQCQRLTVPKIHPITTMSDCLTNAANDTTIILPCLIENRQSLKATLTDLELTICRGESASLPQAGSKPAPTKLLFIIGPEGDFTSDEVNLAIKHGAKPVTLGETVLRVETAAIASVAFVKMFLT